MRVALFFDHGRVERCQILTMRSHPHREFERPPTVVEKGGGSLRFKNGAADEAVG